MSFARGRPPWRRSVRRRTSPHDDVKVDRYAKSEEIVGAVEERLQLVEEMRPLADRAQLVLSLEINGPVSVRADPVRTRQIVRNLLDNAIKNTPAGGSVSLRAAPLRNMAEITVADTGVGIPADQLDAVFEEFVQLKRSPEGGGSGLGLAICRRLADAMGGRITVSSEEGKGSAFVVSLPGGDSRFKIED